MALDQKRLLKPVKNLRKLVSKMERQAPPEKVRDLRTNTRRLEAIFEALSLDQQGTGKSMIKDLKRFRKRAGKVRDMDVLTSYASTVHLEGEEECALQLLEHLGVQRRKYAKKLVAEIKRLGPRLEKDLKRTPVVFAKCIRQNGDATEVAANAAAIAVKLAAQLGTPPHLGRDNLHAYRLKIKDLRNVLQMAAGDSRRFVLDLREVKDAIGEWHDWEQLVSTAQKALDHGSRCALLTELRHIARRQYDHALILAQRLRKTYLRTARAGKNGSSAASHKVPGDPVWDAIAILAA